jgi:hypothetical protein
VGRNAGIPSGQLPSQRGAKINWAVVIACGSLVLATVAGYFAYKAFASKNRLSETIAGTSSSMPDRLADRGGNEAYGTNSSLDHYLKEVLVSSTTAPANSRDMDYSPRRMIDYRADTCWSANVRRDPNPILVFTFNRPVQIHGVHAIPGYKKFYIVDRYLQNHRPRLVMLTYDEPGITDTVEFDHAANYETLDWQTKSLRRPVTTRTVTVRILDTYPGERQGSRAAADDVCISEFHFFGSSAN